MIEWPGTLVDELADRRAIVSGCRGLRRMQRRSWRRNPSHLASITEPREAAGITDAGDLAYVEELVSKELLLDAAEIIFTKVSPPERRKFFRKQLAEPNFIPSEVHQLIQELDAKIVITTNYDQIYEKQCNAGVVGHGYSVRAYHDDDLLNEIRSPDNLIVKAHGCVNHTEKIVVTRSDYFEARRSHWEFYNILDSLLLVNTILFLGCNLNDPDIQLVLENAHIAARCQHPHYALVPKGHHPAIRTAIKNTYNIELHEYEYVSGSNDHSAFVEAIVI